MRSLPLALLFAATLGPALRPACGALPDDEVHTQAIAQPGEVGYNVHLNATPSGRPTPDYPGEIPPAHAWRFVPSVAYGLAPGLEAGMSLPSAWSEGTGGRAGAKVNLKWMPVRVDERERGAYAGVNLEYAWLPRALEPVMRSFEIRPIVGWRGERWRIAFNPILDFDLEGPERGARPGLTPALKLARSVAEGIDAGIEYYAGLGPLGRFLPRAQQSSIAYLALDVHRGPWHFNVGIGRGLNGATDRWTVKAIFDIPI